MQMIRHTDMSDLDALAALESECFPPAEAGAVPGETAWC